MMKTVNKDKAAYGNSGRLYSIRNALPLCTEAIKINSNNPRSGRREARPEAARKKRQCEFCTKAEEQLSFARRTGR